MEVRRNDKTKENKQVLEETQLAQMHIKPGAQATRQKVKQRCVKTFVHSQGVCWCYILNAYSSAISDQRMCVDWKCICELYK